MILDKKQMTEEDIKLQYITPAITSKWNIQKITMETKITDGRVNIKLALGESVRITRADRSAGIVRLREDSFYGTFRRKMSVI